jgi:hypothetical protein
MDNSHLEAYAQNILGQNQVLFDEVKRMCEELLMHTDINDVNRYYEFQDKLTGIYGTLNVAYKDMKARQKNEEVQYYHQLKITAAANHDKFVATVAEKESDYYVAPLRTARDILEGYVETIITAIGTCRSRIYEFQKDKRYDV